VPCRRRTAWQGDAFPLACPDKKAFEFREGALDVEHEVGHGGLLAGEDELSLIKSTRTPFRLRPWMGARGLSRLRAGRSMLWTSPVSRRGRIELWPRRVPAGSLVREDPVQDLALELAFLVLVRRVDEMENHTGGFDPGTAALQLLSKRLRRSLYQMRLVQ
jgi:hypothetical protein